MMPRRPTTVMEQVPLFTVPHLIMQKIRQHGEEVEWMEAKRVNHHFYIVRVRTRPVNREFQSGRARVRAGKRRNNA